VKTHENLFEVVSADFRLERTSIGDEIEKFSARNELLGDVSHLGLSTIFVDVRRVWLDGEVLDQ
jgi:hypothetical protein